MLKTSLIRRCQGLEKLGRHVAAMHNAHNVLQLISIQKTLVLFWNEIWVCQKNIKWLLLHSQLFIGETGLASITDIHELDIFNMGSRG